MARFCASHTSFAAEFARTNKRELLIPAFPEFVTNGAGGVTNGGAAGV
jgi:hypothetical protein